MDPTLCQLKQLIKDLSSYEGTGTALITVIIRPNEKISDVVKKLSDEKGTAVNIKSHNNRLAVCSALTSLIQCLKGYASVPVNGMSLFCGDGKLIEYPHPLPICRSHYECGSSFFVEHLTKLLTEGVRFGYVVITGKGCLFAKLSANTKEILHSFHVDLPNKHRCGGQSSLRFERLRLEKHHNYLIKVAELCTKYFIAEEVMNVKGLVIAGSADMKDKLLPLLDKRITVSRLIDTPHGMETGFNEAIDRTVDLIAGAGIAREKEVLGKLFGEMASDTDKYAIGMDHVTLALEAGAVEILIVWETKDWDIDCSQYGCVKEVVTDLTSEGKQFSCIGGVAAILRYPMLFDQEDRDEVEGQDQDDFSESDFL